MAFVLALTGALVGQAQDGFEIGQAPPAEVAREGPEALGHTRVEPVRWAMPTLVARETNPWVDEGYVGRLAVEDDRGKGPAVPVVAGNQVKREVAQDGFGRQQTIG